MQGKQLVELGNKRIGDKYVLGSIAPKALANYAGPWDCAEFTSWLVYQITNRLYGCANNEGDPNGADAYTGFWARDAKKLGRIVSINEAFQTPGAFLLRVSGNGLIGHIVCSDGKGGTVEAHSTKRGVINSVITGRRWDYGILIPWIAYVPNYIVDVKDQNQKPVEKIYRFTSPLMKDPVIKKIQKALGIKQDGYFGRITFNAVVAFQNKKGLVPDGEAGPKTLKALGII